MRNKWRKSKLDAKKSFLAAKLFGPCSAGKHDQCAVELAMYRCSCSCHYAKSDASEGESSLAHRYIRKRDPASEPHEE